jgi:hypothetical protein
MRKLLLIGASLAVLGAAPAWAGGGTNDNPDHKHQNRHHANPTFDISVAAALAGNSGDVSGNSANLKSQSVSTEITGSYGSSKGVSNQNQNAGANSALQNALALSYIQGCDCANTTAATVAFGATLAVAGNTGTVQDNTSSTGREMTRSRRDGWYGGGISWGPDSSITASISDSYNGDTGVFQVNQNSGANSLLQNSTAVAAATGLKGQVDAGLAVALAGNSGTVRGNRSTDDHTTATGTIDNSFNSDTGVVNANQNVGANSQLQNASALASLQFCGCAADNVSLTIAAAGNDGSVSGNVANAANGSNGVRMTSSFNYSQGMLQANQNAGANSLLQNSIAVGALQHTTTTTP